MAIKRLDNKKINKRLKRLEKEVASVYSAPSKELQKKWDKWAKETAPKIAEAQKKYDEAVERGEGIREAEQNLKNAKIRQTNTKAFKRLMNETIAILYQANQEATAKANDKMIDFYILAYNELCKSIEKEVRK